MPHTIHETCTVSNCGRPHKARGYCQAHYQHFKRGVPIKAEIVRRDTTQYESCSEEGCTSEVKAKGLCKMHYARLLRHGHTRYPDRKRPPKECSVAGCDSHVYAKGLCNQHYCQRRSLGRKYGITVERLDEMMIEQNGLCAVCEGPSTKIHHGSQKVMDLCVDHDHETGKVRGLLCDRCNRAIGLLQDSAANLRRAAAYLERHSPA